MMLRYYWDNIMLKLERFFNFQDPLADYKIYCYDQENVKYSLAEVLYDMKIKIEDLEERYFEALEDIKKLEEENVETTNTLYEVMNCLDAIDARIDILANEWRNGTNV